MATPTFKTRSWQTPAVGVSFKNTEDKSRNACCAAQIFLADRDGVVFLGDKGRWYSERRGDYHLNGESAERLLRGVLATYQQQHGKELNEVFLHCRPTISEEEFEGYQAACVPGVKLVASAELQILHLERTQFAARARRRGNLENGRQRVKTKLHAAN